MPRIGQNPLKWTPIGKRHQSITVTTVVYMPKLSGFWEEGLNVLKLCFRSLHANTGHPFDLMVLDNGSCREVQDYLLECKYNGGIRFLFFSDYNLRKLGAMNMLLAAAPGKIVTFTDSDVYFMPGWLDATLDVLREFPEAGMVTALPTADKTAKYYTSTHLGIQDRKDISVEKGDDLIPNKFIEAHRCSIGKSQKAYSETLNDRTDTRITRNGITAYVAAQDFQFTTRKDVILKVLPLEVRDKEDYYDAVYSPVFESQIDKLGFWRLSTSNYLAHHIGNKMPSQINDPDWIFPTTFSNHSVSSLADVSEYGMLPVERFRKNRFLRRFIKWINAWTYQILYE